MFDLAKEAKNMTAIEILNYYRNMYYTEPSVTERGIVANAINELLPKISTIEIVRCKECKHRYDSDSCPMCQEHCYSDDYSYDYYDVDSTTDDGFCHRGERWTNDAEGSIPCFEWRGINCEK